MKIHSLILHAFVCALLTPALLIAEATIGKPAPDFTLTDSHGQSRSLSDYKGKFIVLEWFNHDCPFVVKHYDGKNMQSLQKKYTDKGVIWLSINSSAEGKQGYLSPARANEVMKDKGAHPTAILLDPTGKTGKAYGARTTPHMYVINPEGVLLYAGAIDDRDSTRLSSLEGAKNFVSSALDEAMEGKNVTLASSEPYGCSIKYAS